MLVSTPRLLKKHRTEACTEILDVEYFPVFNPESDRRGFISPRPPTPPPPRGQGRAREFVEVRVGIPDRVSEVRQTFAAVHDEGAKRRLCGPPAPSFIRSLFSHHFVAPWVRFGHK